MNEEWRDIPGYEGFYQVSNIGRVRSLPRTIAYPAYTTSTGVRKAESLRKFKGQILRPGRTKSGHVSVAIRKGNSKLVHALVMLAFAGPPPAGYEVLHLNHNPSDNRLENLKYGTRSENIKMDYEVGVRKTHKNFIGSRWRKHAEVLVR